MRFWWDMLTDGDEASNPAIPVGQLADLLDNMDMRSVDPDDNNDPDQDCGSTGTADDVTVRLTAAGAATTCNATTCTSAVTAQRTNGQNH